MMIDDSMAQSALTLTNCLSPPPPHWCTRSGGTLTLAKFYHIDGNVKVIAHQGPNSLWILMK